MKNIILAYWLISVLISCQSQHKVDRKDTMFRDGLIYEIQNEEIPFTGLVLDWYANRKKKSEGTYINGKSEGRYTEWYPNGRKASEVNYVNGMEEGLVLAWYENGQKRMEGNFVNGVKEGRWTEWYVNGEKRMEGNFANGKKDGLWTTWYPLGGQKSSEVNFVYGDQVNYVEWDEYGKKTSR